MKSRFYAGLALLAFVLAGCGGGVPTGDIPTLDLEAAIDNPKTFDLGDIAERIDFIPLYDSNHEGLVSEIQRIDGSKGRFYVQDNGRESPIKIFDRTGRFLTTEGRYGRGPGEYTRISYFAADHDTDNPYMAVTGLDGSIVAYDPSGRELARLDSVMAAQMVIHDGSLVLSRNFIIDSGDYTIPAGALGLDPSVDLGNSYAIHNVFGSEGFLFVVAYGYRDNLTARLIFDRKEDLSGFSTIGPDGKPGLFIDGVKFTPAYLRDNRLVGYLQALDIVDNRASPSRVPTSRHSPPQSMKTATP